jgi:ribose 5-phosphate isomerase B
MRVHMGSDHAGFELKNFLVQSLTDDGHEVVDHGPTSYDAEDDYPEYCIPAAEAVVGDPGSLGIVIGGSGNGEQIAANKVRGTRAALAYSVDTARLAREHNNANVMAIGARMHSQQEAWELVQVFLATSFSGDPRHARRIAMLAAYETRHDYEGRSDPRG